MHPLAAQQTSLAGESQPEKSLDESSIGLLQPCTQQNAADPWTDTSYAGADIHSFLMGAEATSSESYGPIDPQSSTKRMAENTAGAINMSFDHWNLRDLGGGDASKIFTFGSESDALMTGRCQMQMHASHCAHMYVQSGQCRSRP